MADYRDAFLLYLRAADELAHISASKKLTHATMAAAKAKLRAAQQAYWDAVDGKVIWTDDAVVNRIASIKDGVYEGGKSGAY